MTYCNLYLEVGEGQEGTSTTTPSVFDISVVSELVRPQGYNSRARLSGEDILEAHWQVLLNCDEVSSYLDAHEELYTQHYPDHNDKDRRLHFHRYFIGWVSILRSYVIHGFEWFVVIVALSNGHLFTDLWSTK